MSISFIISISFRLFQRNATNSLFFLITYGGMCGKTCISQRVVLQVPYKVDALFSQKPTVIAVIWCWRVFKGHC